MKKYTFRKLPAKKIDKPVYLLYCKESVSNCRGEYRNSISIERFDSMQALHNFIIHSELCKYFPEYTSTPKKDEFLRTEYKKQFGDRYSVMNFYQQEAIVIHTDDKSILHVEYLMSLELVPDTITMKFLNLLRKNKKTRIYNDIFSEWSDNILKTNIKYEKV